MNWGEGNKQLPWRHTLLRLSMRQNHQQRVCCEVNKTHLAMPGTRFLSASECDGMTVDSSVLYSCKIQITLWQSWKVKKTRKLNYQSAKYVTGCNLHPHSKFQHNTRLKISWLAMPQNKTAKKLSTCTCTYMGITIIWDFFSLFGENYLICTIQTCHIAIMI